MKQVWNAKGKVLQNRYPEPQFMLYTVYSKRLENQAYKVVALAGKREVVVQKSRQQVREPGVN